MRSVFAIALFFASAFAAPTPQVMAGSSGSSDSSDTAPSQMTEAESMELERCKSTTNSSLKFTKINYHATTLSFTARSSNFDYDVPCTFEAPDAESFAGLVCAAPAGSAHDGDIVLKSFDPETGAFEVEQSWKCIDSASSETRNYNYIFVGAASGAIVGSDCAEGVCYPDIDVGYTSFQGTSSVTFKDVQGTDAAAGGAQ